MDNTLKTYTSSLKTLRNEANEDSPLIAIATESNYAQKPSGAINVNSSKDESKVNGMQISIAGGSNADETLSWILYGWRKGNGVATLICSGTAILGTMQLVIYPNGVGTADRGAAAPNRFWADTISIVNNNFVKSWSVTDSGNNRAAILAGDLAGFNDLYLEIQDADGTGAEADSISAFYAGW